MDINLGGNTLTNGYFAGIVSGPDAGNHWIILTASYSASSGDKLLADTTSAAFTITLPAFPSIGDQIDIGDPQGTWATNPLILDGNGDYINGNSTSCFCAASGAMAQLIYVGGTAGWRVYGAAVLNLNLGLIAEYLFDPGSELLDTSGNGSTLTNINGVTFSSNTAHTVGDNAVTSSSILISPATNNGLSAGTYACIVNNISAPIEHAGALFADGGATGTWTGGNVVWEWNQSGANIIHSAVIQSGNSIASPALANTWHYVVLRVNGDGTFDAWIDGVNIGNALTSPYGTIVGNGILIGALDHEFFDGACHCDFQKFRAWNRALTDAEIAILAAGY